MKKIFISLVMALALVSCSTDELSNGGTPASDKGSVQLVLSTDGFDEIDSRTVDDEDAIHDVNILEYVHGVPVQVVYLTQSNTDFSQDVKVYGLTDLPATTMDKATDAEGNEVQVMQENGVENFIFVVANYGGKINSEDISSLEKLKAFKMKFSGKTDMTNLPMTGFYYGGIDAVSTTTMEVKLQRAVAKVNFTLDTSSFTVGGKTPEQFSVNSIKLCNVPENITLYPCKVRPSLPKSDTEAGKWNFGTQTPFPTTSEMASSVTYGDAQNQSSDANTYVAYIPENVRGSYDNITDNKDKRPSRCGDNPISESAEKTEKNYTYILVDLLYVMSNGTAGNATYRIYLGGNSTGDMNLLRNTEYTVNTRLNSANSADTRISVNDVSDTYLAAANCYMIDMSNGAKNVIIPLSQVNKGWAKIAEYDDTQTTTASAVKTMLESGNWEIQTEWKTWEGSSNVKGTKVADFSASNLKATLTIPADVKNGNNAVVKLVSTANDDTNGKTYWSWHLWFTDYKPSAASGTARNGQVHQYISDAFKAGGTYYGKYMMDRNLGATITGISGAINQPTTNTEAVKYYGLHYQFGRKDPFVGSADGTGNKIKLHNAQGGDYTQDTDSATTLANSVQKPGTFFVGSGSSAFDWLSAGSINLWSSSGTAKSVFDPCPPGWCIPLGGTAATNNPWAGFGDGFASSTGNGSWSGFAWKNAVSGQTGTVGRLYNYNGTQAWYPASGNLLSTTGNLRDIGNDAGHWNSKNNLYFKTGSAYPVWSASTHADGFSVRCIQE